MRLSVRQLSVLSGARDGLVWEHYPNKENRKDIPWSTLDMGAGAVPRHSVVTGACRLLSRNSLITLSKVTSELTGARQWAITDDGIQELLDRLLHPRNRCII